MAENPVAGYPVTACMTCGSDALRQILDLGDQPLAERDDGNRYPLGLLECAACGLIQVSYAVGRAAVFPEDHPYASGNTRALREHFAGLAAEVARIAEDGGLVIDIGCNDGTFLAAVRRENPVLRLLGIEPTGQADTAQARGLDVRRGFFSWKMAREIVRAHGYPQAVTASNVLAHAGDQHDFLSGVALLCEAGGTFVTENHLASSVTNGLQIDTVYHEHLRFYSPGSLGQALAMHSLDVIRMETIGTHGGSFRTYAARRRGGLQHRAGTARDQLQRLMEIASEDGPVWGIGAATRATPLIHFAQLWKWMHAVCEVPGSAKIGTLIPGTALAVVDERELIGAQPPYALLLCWHIADDIVPKLRAAGYQGRFIVPLPAPRVLDD